MNFVPWKEIEMCEKSESSVKKVEKYFKIVRNNLCFQMIENVIKSQV